MGQKCRAANLPLYKYLGAAYEDTVPAYASGGYYLEGKTPEMLGEEMAGYVALGLDAVKMKVGRGDLRSEEARIAAARKAIGPDVLLMLDANNAWSDVPTALRFMDRFAPYDPYWIEEPFSPDQIDNHAKLAALISIPVATGEIEAGRWRFKELLDKQAASILQADAVVCGGITEFRRIAALADCYGVTSAPTGSTICTHTWSRPRPMASSSNTSPTAKYSTSAKSSTGNCKCVMAVWRSRPSPASATYLMKRRSRVFRRMAGNKDGDSPWILAFEERQLWC